MPPIPSKLLASALALTAAGALSACQSTPSASTSSPAVQAEGAGVRCPGGDHPMQDAQLGWSFCYPPTWRFRERAQSSTAPAGIDLTFDITDDSGSGPGRGLFGYMIIGTYERGASASLAQWVAANVGQQATLQPLRWGNALEAGALAGSGQWFALTGRHVIQLTLREGSGNLPLTTEMARRFSSWKFTV
ncbi:MAG: hypothetical protein ACREPA_11670 [Candidatus Dormibacteraceae bacterium]